MEAIIFIRPYAIEPGLWVYDDGDEIEALKKYIECADIAGADYDKHNVNLMFTDELQAEVSTSLAGTGYQLFWKFF